MAQITIQLPDDKVSFFKKLVSQLGFATVQTSKPAQAGPERIKMDSSLSTESPRKLGGLEGYLKMADDFDEPMDITELK